MPLYDFQCNNCGFIEEALATIKDNRLCPQCGKEMKRLPSYPALVKIKGMGGYPARRKQIKGTAPYV